MRKLMVIKTVFPVLTILALSIMPAGCGHLGVQPGIRAEVMMSGGDKVRLYYEGPQDAKEMFCIGETVVVYRAYPQERLRYVEVGKVNIVKAIDKHNLEGVVVNGKLKEGDLARKSIAACKVLPPMPAVK